MGGVLSSRIVHRHVLEKTDLGGQPCQWLPALRYGPAQCEALVGRIVGPRRPLGKKGLPAASRSAPRAALRNNAIAIVKPRRGLSCRPRNELAWTSCKLQHEHGASLAPFGPRCSFYYLVLVGQVSPRGELIGSLSRKSFDCLETCRAELQAMMPLVRAVSRVSKCHMLEQLCARQYAPSTYHINQLIFAPMIHYLAPFMGRD